MELVIVESPKKAKEIAHFLGSGYIVKASMGHFKDLPQKELGVDLNTYEPVFDFLDAKHKEVFKEIYNLAKSDKVTKIYIATDPDREGYAIATMLYEELKKTKKPIYRVEFREITKKHVLEQLKSGAVPFEQTNKGLFKAFLGRRVGDRLVGYLLSPKHSQKLKSFYSVGRVQSPAVRIVVEREREIQNFKPTPYYVISALLEKDKIQFKAFYDVKGRLEDKSQAEKIYNDIKDEKTATVVSVEKKEVKQSPSPPFTTSTLQQASSLKLRFAPEKTMQLAQNLFEAGLITYHRTDSVRMSDEAVQGVRDLILKLYGKNYLPAQPRMYKSKNTQADAHEGIRITHFVPLEEQQRLINEKQLTEDHFKLLKLIYERTLACQMVDAVFDRTIVKLDIKSYPFKATGSVLKFNGFLAVYQEAVEDDKQDEAENDKQKLPELKSGDKANILKIENQEKWTEPPPRYSEASLVRKLEELGIGRPSTYASIMKTIKERNYVVVEKGKLKPTERGYALVDSLKETDEYVIDYNFTKEMEQFLDDVEENKKDWKEFVKIIHGKIGYVDLTKKFGG